MKKLYMIIATTLIGSSLFAGGILTNTNQSVVFTRMQALDATLGIEAVYFNPAGLTLLPNNGFYLSLSNQTLGQTRTITSDYTYLNNGEYIGNVSAPFFPGVYAAYKMDKFVFSAGFNPIGGGGGGTYDDGLPSFEYGVSDLVPALASQGAQGYKMDVYFEGSSAWFGYQANISYQVNDMISIALGARFVQAKDTYDGYLNDIELNMGGTWTPAHLIMTGIATQATGGGDGLQPLVDGGAGGLTPEQALGAGYIDQATHDAIVGGLTGLGVDPSGLTIEESQAAYYGAAAKYTGTASILQNQEAVSEATASGVTPIISVNIKPNDQFNFSFKYEHNTKLDFTYNTEKDFTTGFFPDGTPETMFPDATTYRKDLPAQIVVGATYKPMDKLLISTGYHTYLDKSADWAGEEDLLDGNSWEFALGLEYSLSEKLAASAGWLTTNSGVTEAYQSDLSHSLPSNTFGGGIEYKINEKININLAGSYTTYTVGEKNFENDLAGSGTMVPVKETYDKPIWIVAIGASINFGAVK